MRRAITVSAAAGALLLPVLVAGTAEERARAGIGREVAVAVHLEDDEEFRISLPALIEHGRRLFDANWTHQEGAGRPLSKGSGKALADPADPLAGSRSMNRISGPDANSCFGCHNAPYGISGGGGDFVTNVFVLAHRFDFVTMSPGDAIATKGTFDEQGRPVTIDTVGNLRATTGMFGAGYLEMLARQMTADLQAIRDAMQPGETRELVSKGVGFGTLTRRPDGLWDTSNVEGLSRLSLLGTTPTEWPTLIIRPWHQAGNVVSIREFSNNAFNHHHGIQPSERFGLDSDHDGDGFRNEMTRADQTAVSVYQATLAVPGRVIPNDPVVEDAVLSGEQAFHEIGCTSCHVSRLPLDRRGWIYSEPNPYNPATNLRVGEAKTLEVDLGDPALPVPRLPVQDGVVWVDAYTDFKLHDITSGPDDENSEALDMNHGTWSAKFSEGNRRFLTKRLWGCANEPPYFHHGRFTTLRQAVLAHAGEALAQRRAFESLPQARRDDLIEFLKTLQVLPPDVIDRVVDEKFRKKEWPPQRTRRQAELDPVARASAER